MHNQYPGPCCVCKRIVPAGKGRFESVTAKARRRWPKTYGRVVGAWAVRCADCIGKGHPADEGAELHAASVAEGED